MRHCSSASPDGSSNGQLSDGSLTSFVVTPQQVPGIANAVDVASGPLHSLALLADGRVFAWGANGLGQLGDGSVLRKRSPGDTRATAVTRIRAGGNISLAVTQEGVLLAWGENSDGQLGRGTATTHDVPTPTGIASDVVDAAATDLFLLVATSDGSRPRRGSQCLRPARRRDDHRAQRPHAGDGRSRYGSGVDLLISSVGRSFHRIVESQIQIQVCHHIPIHDSGQPATSDISR